MTVSCPRIKLSVRSEANVPLARPVAAATRRAAPLWHTWHVASANSRQRDDLQCGVGCKPGFCHAVALDVCSHDMPTCHAMTSLPGRQLSFGSSARYDLDVFKFEAGRWPLARQRWTALPIVVYVACSQLLPQ